MKIFLIITLVYPYGALSPTISMSDNITVPVASRHACLQSKRAIETKFNETNLGGKIRQVRCWDAAKQTDFTE